LYTRYILPRHRGPGSYDEISGTAVSKVPGLPDNTNISLMLAPASPNYPVYLSLPRTNVARGGHFEFRDVFPGAYIIWARQAGPQGSFIAAVEVTVRNADIADLNVIVQPGVDLAGHLTVVGDAELPPTLNSNSNSNSNSGTRRSVGRQQKLTLSSEPIKRPTRHRCRWRYPVLPSTSHRLWVKRLRPAIRIAP
jgi:hypothetical protein